MPAYSRHMPQAATYWAPLAPDQFNKVGLAAPATILCRWENKAELVTDPNGNQFASSSIIYSEETLARQGWLFLGVSVAADPRQVEGAKEIRQTMLSQNLSGTISLNKAVL